MNERLVALQRILHANKVVLVPPVVAAAIYVYFLRTLSSRRRPGGVVDVAEKPRSGAKSTRQRVGVNRRFFTQMRKLLPILVPSTRRRYWA
jgi:hypothetical protein